jgi:hypothetical protein
MGAKIHLYPIERFTFGDEDYYDIDYFDGLIYQTAKIKGSTIKAGIVADLPSVDTIYNADGTINSDRIITGANFELFFQQLGKFIVHSHKNNTDNVTFEVRTQTGNYSFSIKDHNTGQQLFTIINGKVKINNNYFLPTSDGSAGQVMTTDGAGNVTFQNVTAPFIPDDITETEIKRGVIAISGSTSQATFGGLPVTNTGSIVAVLFGGVVKLPKVRLLTTTGSTNSTVGIAFGSSGVVNTVGWGFRFVGSWIYSDQSAGGTNWFVPGARQFVGLSASNTILGIASGVTVESQTNIIGIGSDSLDVNLQIFHNDGTGTATKIDLGANFPANKTGAVANGEAYQLELYNAFGQTSVKYRVRKLSDGTETTGTITTNLPSVSIGPQIVRTSGTTSQNVSIELIRLTANTKQ